MRLIDISPSLRVGMAVFPGDAEYRVAQTFTISPGCPVNVGSFAMSTHCGAHADAPLHYDAGGASIDRLDLDDFIGPARVIDARGKDPLCHDMRIVENLVLADVEPGDYELIALPLKLEGLDAAPLRAVLRRPPRP